MPDLDWKNIESLDIDNLADDESKADNLYEALGDFDAVNQSDVQRLQKLFSITQALMLIKGTQAQVAEEELAQSASHQGKSNANRDQEIEDLKQTVKYQKKKLVEAQEKPTTAAGGRDSRYLRDELDAAEHLTTSLQREVKDRERQLQEERIISERYISRAEAAEKDLREVRRENENMQEEIRDYQRQLDAQRETMVTKRDEDADHHVKLKQKNILLSDALDENKNLVDENEQLLNKLSTMKQELQDGKFEIERTTEDYLKLKSMIQKSDEELLAVQRENDMQRHQIDNFVEQLRQKNDSDDEIISQVNRKVEQWKTLLDSKEAELDERRGEISRLRASIVASNMDNGKRQLAALTQAVEDRDHRIHGLEVKLNAAVTDMHTNASLMDNIRDSIKQGVHGGNQQECIAGLLKKLKVVVQHWQDSELKAEEADRDARTKDKSLSDMLERMSQYEAGIYQLPEAVAEIKDLKTNVILREKQIEDLTQYINKCEMKLNDVFDEVEELRERCGLDPKEPIDLGEFRAKKSVKTQEHKALNLVLQKEIERLEEERVELKQEIRRLAQSTGKRALTIGLQAEDVSKVNDYVDELKLKSRRAAASTLPSEAAAGADDAINESSKSIQDNVVLQELKLRNGDLIKELESTNKKQRKLLNVNAELQTKNSQYLNENSSLQLGLQQIKDALQSMKADSSSKNSGQIECPALEQMLAAMETRNAEGSFDTLLCLKTKVANLQGHNDELRAVLRETRYESQRDSIALDKANTQVTNLTVQLDAALTMNKGVQICPLPRGMSPSSSDFIAALNDHLMNTLHDLKSKEEELEELRLTIEDYKRKFSIQKHQISLLYKDFELERIKFQEQDVVNKKEVAKYKSITDDDKLRLIEFDRLVDTLSQDDVEVRRRCAEMTRRLTLYKVNEATLVRRHQSSEEVEETLRKNITKLEDEIIQMETTVAERMTYLQRFKDNAAYKLTTLQKQLDMAVPSNDLAIANHAHSELTEKYRDLLTRSNELISLNDAGNKHEAEAKRLLSDNDSLRSCLAVEKEKLHNLEAQVDTLRRVNGELPTTDAADISLAARLTTVELKELNERQRADHAVNMYQGQKAQLTSVEERNFNLEMKFAELTKLHLELQKSERKVQDRLSECVTKENYELRQCEILKMEKEISQLRDEVAMLKNITEVATMQASSFENRNVGREKELFSLRHQLVDLQTKSDDKAAIGKLHRLTVQLRINECDAVKRDADQKREIRRLHGELLKRDQRLDDRETALWHSKGDARARMLHLKTTIQDLRSTYAGAIPLKQQEQFTATLIAIQKNKLETESKLKQMISQKMDVEDKLSKVQLQCQGLQELMATIKDGRGAAKISEWQDKMQALRLVDLRQKRDLERMREQHEHDEANLNRLRRQVESQEENTVLNEKKFEERELSWHTREVELERRLDELTAQNDGVTSAALQFDEAVNQMPNPDWPISRQLEHSTTVIQRNVKTILTAKAEVAVFKKQIDDLEGQLRVKGREVINCQKSITELRLRMPATKERDQAFCKAVENTTTIGANGDGPISNNMQALKVAQATIESLQTRLHQKTESLNKLELRMAEDRENIAKSNAKHNEELRLMQVKLNEKSDSQFDKFKSYMLKDLSKEPIAVASNEQMKRLEQLEDIVSDQDSAITSLKGKLDIARQDAVNVDIRHRREIDEYKDNRNRREDDAVNFETKTRHDLNQRDSRIAELERCLDVVEADLVVEKEKARQSPSQQMKSLLERLKIQLSTKEKQYQSLSKSLLDLRADLVTQAQNDVKVTADRQANEKTVQQRVQKETQPLQNVIDELQEENENLKKFLKKLRSRESALTLDLDEERADTDRKDLQLKRAKDEKLKLQTEVEDLHCKVERINSMAKQNGVSAEMKVEMDELRRRNRVLEAAQSPDVDQDNPDDIKKQTNNNKFAKWEEQKKMQRIANKLRQRLKDKQEEMDKMSRSNDLLKAAVHRANSAAAAAQQTAQARHKPANLPSDLATPAPPASLLSALPPKEIHQLVELQEKNYALEQQLEEAKKNLMVGQEKAFERNNMKQEFLQDTIASLEVQVSTLAQYDKTGATLNTQTNRLDREIPLQRQVLKLSEENIEQRFELEQLKSSIPVLKQRIHDLEQYIEVLKREKNDLENADHSLAPTTSAATLSLNSGNIKKVGESGRSQKELEKTISLLKKVIDKSHNENLELKRAAATANGQFPVQSSKNLSPENNDSRMYSSISELSLEQLRCKLVKESAMVNTLKVKLKNIAQKNRYLEVMNSKLSEAPQKPSASSSSSRDNSLADDVKSWKSAVSTRHYEAKLQSSDDLLAKKTAQLSESRITIKTLEERICELLSKGKKGGSDEIKSLKLEHQRQLASQNKEIDLLKAELANFGPDFFEEIEDLKYNYKQAVQLNVEYEQKMRELGI